MSAAEMRTVAADLRRAIDSSLSPEVRAYGALHAGADVEPWTAEAEATWRATDGADPWHDHDLAVALHARAYDLEQERSHDAYGYWREALAHWSAVCADDAIWRLLRETRGEELPDEVVERARSGMPRHLLGVHEALVEDYRHGDRERARQHMRILKSAPFDRELIEAARSRLVKPALDGAASLGHASQYEDAVAELEPWLFVDEGNLELIRLLLYTLRNWNRSLFQLDEYDRVLENVQMAEAALDQLPEATRSGPLAAETARVRYWRGLYALATGFPTLDEGTPPARRRALELLKEASEQLGAADEIDPTMVDDPYYGDARALRAKAEAACGRCELEMADGDDAHNRAAQDHCRRAIELDPEDPVGYVFLAAAMVAPPTVSKDTLLDAEAQLELARGKIDDASEQGARQFVERIEQQIGMHRLFHGLQSGGTSNDPAEVLAQLKRMIET